MDIREMHHDDVDLLWNWLLRILESDQCDDVVRHFKVSKIDDEWFVDIKGCINGDHWAFSSHGRGWKFNEDESIDVSNAIIFVDYYPPGGGDVRFDTKISNPVILKEYGEILVKHGNGGKDRLSRYQSFELPERVNAKPKRQSIWQIIKEELSYKEKL